MISHYRVTRRLGAGGMGEVLLAHDTKLERSVAIKVMSTELSKNQNQRKRFSLEAKAASGLNHPNICVIHEVGETSDGRPFLAMEYIEGETLEGILSRRRVKIREAISIGAQVADALDAAHSRGIVHRDIKPGNIMLDKRGRAKVLDFGLAKKFGPPDATSTPSDSDTATGFLIGTPHYMSPEQALGGELDSRSDIFSLGVVLYELVAGQRPFLGKTVGEAINKIVNQEPRPLGLENPRFTPALDGIIFKCLAKEPEQRYASAKELAADLAKLEAGTQPTPAAKNDAVAKASDFETKLWQLAAKTKMKPAGFKAVAVLVLLGLLAAVGTALFRPKKTVTAIGGNPAPAMGARFAEKSVAVLPFDNYSAEKETDYLSDGLTEEITTALSRIPGLKVAARNSAFTFKGKNEDLRKVGAALGVATLLEGSVRKSGRQIRVTAQLVNVTDGFHLWSETYDSSMEDIIALQEEIARKIAERFELKAGDVSTVKATTRPAPKPEVYALYLQGLHLWNKRTTEDIEKAAQLFKQAIDQDASYAAGHAGLAACYALLPSYALRPQKDYFPLARAAAGKALELDPASADAHAVLGLVNSYGFDFAGAETEFKQAIRLNPNHATAHHWYGVLLMELGRLDESRAELHRAEVLDPLSPIIKINLLANLVYRREYDRGIAECRVYQQTFPDFALFRESLAKFHILQGRFPEAIGELLTLRSAETNAPNHLDALGYCYARSGDETSARKTLGELEDWKKKGYAVQTMIGFVYLGLRDYERCFDACEEALDAGETLSGLLHDPAFDEVRSLSRFQSLMKKVGLKP
jgi:TolB-like protein/Tfp pilus assembly protein PilF/predicted Ser/Thr protein kinase